MVDFDLGVKFNCGVTSIIDPKDLFGFYFLNVLILFLEKKM